MEPNNLQISRSTNPILSIALNVSAITTNIHTTDIKIIFSQRLMSVFNDRDVVDDDKNMTRKNSNFL